MTLDEAIEAHRNGDLDAAEKVYMEHLSANPDDHKALSVAAILDHQRDRHKEAIARLEQAIAIAPQEAGYCNNLANIYRSEAQPQKALAWYRKALEITPGDIDTICNVGSLCDQLDLLDDAREALEAAKSADPNHPETNHNLAMVYSQLDMEEAAIDCIEAIHAGPMRRVNKPTYHARVLSRFGRRDRALEILERYHTAFPDDPEVAYEFRSLRGDDMDRAPDDYVRKHFDGFAEGFDSQLEKLGYVVPERLGALATALIGDDKVPLIVDLGCGTGLMGQYLCPLCKVLIGVDLSPAMLRLAERRGQYDQLGEGELVQALNNMPEGIIDFATAADTLCYFGPLDDVFAGLAHGLREGGAFIATVESHEGEDGPKHLVSGRFSHSEAYIRRTAEAQGLSLRIAQDLDLRTEFGEPVKGIMFALQNADQ